MVRLRRGPAALTVYGVGGMLGGGIYALVGQVAANAGTRSWLAFALAMLVAAPTALVYAELAGRFPKSGGEAWFCQVAFERVAVARLVGWAVLLSGVVSMATLARAFAGYVADLAPGAPAWLVAPAFLAGLAAINLRGIRLSSLANVVCTVVEVAGLVVVVLAGALLLAGGASVRAESPPPPAGLGVLQGAALAFYAFIGFEDMVNVAEEVRRPARAYARAIPTALVAVGCVYGAVAWSSTAAVGPAVLAASDAPLSEVVAASALPIPRPAFSVVALFAVANSALLNSVMASRLTYGMAGQGLVPATFHALLPRWRTPHRAIGAVLLATALLAASGGVAFLAGATSCLLLAVFFTVDLAHTRIRRRDGPPKGFRCSPILAWTGAALSAALACLLPLDSILAAATLVALGALGMAVHGRLARRR